MMKVEDEVMARLPDNLEELWQFIDEMPYWMAENHGRKYRVMYQVFTHPKYRRYGQEFMKGIDERYDEYAKTLAPKLGISHEKITSLILILFRTCVHYALFEDAFYLKSQIEVIKETLTFYMKKTGKEKRRQHEEKKIIKFIACKTDGGVKDENETRKNKTNTTVAGAGLPGVRCDDCGVHTCCGVGC